MAVYLSGETWDGRDGPLTMLFADSSDEFETFTAAAGIDLGNTRALGVVAHTINEIQTRIAHALGAIPTDEFGYTDWQARRAGAWVTVNSIGLGRAAILDAQLFAWRMTNG